MCSGAARSPANSRARWRSGSEVDGDLTQVPEIPAALRALYRTAFQIEPEWLIDAAARRQKWIDQSQSLNLFLAAPDMRAMSPTYRRAWRGGLKTTYYLRTLGASAIEKATAAAPPLATAPLGATAEPALDAAVLACSIEAMRNGEGCEACQ